MLIAVRALHFWAIAVLLGGSGLLLALHRRDRATVIALRFAALAAAVTGAIWFALVFIDVLGAPSALVDTEAWAAFLSAPFGVPWLVRLLLCALALAVAARGTPALCLVLGIVFTLDQAWLGHAANGSGLDAVVQVSVYWMHVIAGLVWVGALMMLCLLTIIDKRVPPEGLGLFSLIGTFVVVAILASGIANAALRGLRIADLATTGYGRILALKLALFVAMVALAMFNRFGRRHDRPLRLSLAAETGLGLIVIAAAAALGVTPPP